MTPLMAPGRRFVPIEEARRHGCREAAVLVLVYPHQCQAHTVLTLRPDHLPEHGGQVSLPGGRLEAGEDSLAAAVREAREELGITIRRRAAIGTLTAVYIPPTDYCLTPWVAVVERRPAFVPRADEVAELIEVPLDAMAQWQPEVAEWHWGGQLRRVPAYAIGGHWVWGATAMILAELAAIWRQVAARFPTVGDPQMAQRRVKPPSEELESAVECPPLGREGRAPADSEGGDDGKA